MTDDKTEPAAPDKGPRANSETSNRGVMRLLLLGPRVWKRWWTALLRSVEHGEIRAQVTDQSGFSFNYAFMVTAASGIAIIGLLLNSPAVIIGAMLISPLMGPIVGTGFALAGFDIELGKRSAAALLYGAATAIAVATFIVLVSPIQEITPEILARTRPTLFDLVIAMLAGAAGGYGMIRGRGGAIVGVAIATALMPPLAVIGYGLATWHGAVIRGALLLFTTNMVAMAVAVAAVAEWYGFGRGGVRKRFARQTLISLLVLAPLVVPLFISLQSIAWEGRAHAKVRTILETAAQGLEQGQVAQFRLRFVYDQPPFIEAIIVSENPDKNLRTRLATELEGALGVPVNLHLTQVRADNPAQTAHALAEAPESPAIPRAETDMASTLRKELPFPVIAVNADVEHRTLTVVPGYSGHMDLAAWRDVETEIASHHPDWHVSLLPPATGLPRIEFASAADSLDTAAGARLDVILWALKRWGQHTVEIVGHASTKGGGPRSLATRRAVSVANWLADHGVRSTWRTMYPLPGQAALEREEGDATFRSVEINLPVSLSE